MSTDRVTMEDLSTAIEWLGAYEAHQDGGTIDSTGACGEPFAESLLRVRARLMAELEAREEARMVREKARVDREIVGMLKRQNIKPTPNAMALVRGKLDRILGR